MKGEIALCDRGLRWGWYRFKTTTNLEDKMPEKAPPEFHCGTHDPIWLQGSHPTVAEGNVVRKVCINSIGVECDDSFNINVTNCGSYFVYYLRPPSYCAAAYCAGSVPEVSPPSETIELNRTSSVNLTCLVSGQPGVHVEWYKNGLRIPDPPLSNIHRMQFINGSVRSVLMLARVKYKDRGSVVSCTAWYPLLSFNSTRNIHLIVHAPRPVVVIKDVQSRTMQVRVSDPTPMDTAKYIVRYKTHTPYSDWVRVERNKTSKGRDTLITLDSLHPYTTYLMEVASHYTDDDEGPYSVPHQFTTQQAAPSSPPRDVVIIPRGKNTMRVSWWIPSAQDCNGKITKYEVVLYKPNGDKETFMSEDNTLSKDISGLETNQHYYVGVRAYTKVGPGPYSSNLTYSSGTEDTR